MCFQGLPPREVQRSNLFSNFLLSRRLSISQAELFVLTNCAGHCSFRQSKSLKHICLFASIMHIVISQVMTQI